MAKPLRALVVEDSEDDYLLLVRELSQGGYEAVCERVDTREAFQEALARKEWDLVIADYTMPEFSGTDALKLFKSSGLDVPFIFVSGTLGEDTAVGAMKTGAHDYIMKGNVKRLLPAIERELREAAVRRERAQADEKIRRQQEQLRLLYEVNLAITSTLDLEAVLDRLLEKVDIVLPRSAAVSVRLLEEKTGQLKPVASRNIEEIEWGGNGWGTGRSLSQLVLDTKAPLMIRNVQENPGIMDHEFFRKHGLVSYLGLPLSAKEGILGVIGFYTKEQHRFTQEEIDFFETLAGQAAIAIHNSRLYEQRKVYANELENANRAISEFVNFVAHEMRTPLTVIMSYAGMLQEGALGGVNSAQGEALAKVLRSSYELLDLASGVLEVGKVRAKEIQIESSDLSLVDFLMDLETLYSISVAKKINFIWDYPSSLPVIRTDAKKLRHILQNLINNAIKFTEHGQVKVSARHDKKARTVEFKVADTGRGIPKESLSEIFEMFQQVKWSGKGLDAGVGLGLHIAKKFTELLGGSIAVESKIGEGTAFTVTIPCEIQTDHPAGKTL